MEKIRVNAKSKTYDIIIDNSFNQLNEMFRMNHLDNKKICIVTDDNVEKYHLKAVQEHLTEISEEVTTFVFPHGEDNKNLETVYKLYDHLITSKLDRDSIIVALGGGVTGDLAGFAASTYMRGIRFVQIPTSLLAQVDSSVGGKTGVDFKGYKNCVGAFWQPELVYINTETLKTLPEREFSSGMGEVIKHGLIQDIEYFNFINSNYNGIKNLDPTLLEQLIVISCKIKSGVVSQDEKENGLRATLNFGHTIGHAIERLLDFRLFHGECVAIGMVAAAYLSKSLGYIDDKDIQQVKECLAHYNLPIKADGLTTEEIYKQLFYDKKTKNNVINFIVLDAMGSCTIKNNISKDKIISCIEFVLS